MPYTYPILLDLSARLCLVVGGGAVAERKVAGLVEAGAARVRVVAPRMKATFATGVELITDAYGPAHLDGVWLAFAATDVAEVNDAVVRDARQRGILVSRVDTEEELNGDFTVPARFREGAVMVTVSAGSAALAVQIRDSLARRWDPRWTQMAEAMQVLRPELRGSDSDLPTRRQIFRELASEEALEVLGARGLDGLRSWMKDRASRSGAD